MCGLPGSGKTTEAKKLAAELCAVRLCPDEWLSDLGFDVFDQSARDRVEGRLWDLAEELLAKRMPAVILEDGFWSREERDGPRLRARSLGFAIELRYLAVPSAELHRRVAARNHEPRAAVITPGMLAEYEGMFEAPTPAELDLFDPPPD
jgi:predicted kinase